MASRSAEAGEGWASRRSLLIFAGMTGSNSWHRRHSRRRLGAVASATVMLLFLNGCESLDFLRSPEPPPPAEPPPAAPPPAPERARLAPAPPPRPAPQPLPELKVVGLSQPETETLLGPPTTASDRPPAKVWEYRIPDCALDVYFYLDVGRNAFYALHYDSPTLNSSGASATVSVPDAADRCLRRIYNARRQP